MKKIAGLIAVFLICSGVFAIDVNKGELESAQKDSVQFENYGGPHAVIESADAILGIGRALGEEVAADVENPLSVQPHAKYSLYHVVGSPEEKGLDADILFLNANAGVDHIGKREIDKSVPAGERHRRHSTLTGKLRYVLIVKI